MKTKMALIIFCSWCLGMLLAHHGGISWTALGGITLISYSYTLDDRLRRML